MSFDGKQTYVKVQVPDCQVQNPFALNTLTYETWVYFYEFLNPYQWIMGQGGDQGVKFHREGTTTNIGFVNSNGVDECFQSMRCANVPEKTWYHVAVSFNGTHFFFYCNGHLPPENVINCEGKGAPGKWDRRIDIGQDHKQPKTRNTYGMLDEMRVWNRFLSLEEINEKRFRELTEDERKDPTLEQYYTFDMGEGQFLKDEASDNSSIELDGSLGDDGDNFRISNQPIWIPSPLKITNGACISETKYGIPLSFYFPIYRVEANYTVDLSRNYTYENLIVFVSSLPDTGYLFFLDESQTKVNITKLPLFIVINNLTYVPPDDSEVVSLKTTFQYCLFSKLQNKTLSCQNFIFKVEKNEIPFPGSAGTALLFDGIDDYVFSETFNWPAAQYFRDYGGGPVTIEWWGANFDTDFQIDNLLASGSSVFSVGSTEIEGLFCEEFCYGRFQAHAPWVDGFLSWDYGWVPGVRGRTTKKMFQYFNRWTHYTLVSEGRNGTFQGIYLDGEPFLIYNASANDSNALPADGTNHDLVGLFIGCWPYFNLCFRGYIDEFRVWNVTRSHDEIKSSMNIKIKKHPNLYAYYDFNEVLDGNTIQDISGNNFELKMGGCSNKTTAFGDRTYCNGSFENTTISSAYPQVVRSYALVDDEINTITVLAGSKFTFVINGTDLNGDPLTVQFLTSTQKCLITINNQIISPGSKFSNENHTVGNFFNQWSVLITLSQSLAGYPLETFSYFLTDGISNSSIVEISINVYCDIGRYFHEKEGLCLPCDAGSYNNQTHKNSCLLCPLGTFQPMNESASCIDCRNGYTTLSPGQSYCVYQYQTCVFKSDLKYNRTGVFFCVCVVCISGAVLFFILISSSIRGRKKTNSKSSIGSSSMQISSKKKKISTLDILEIINFNVIFLQLLYLSIVYNPDQENQMFFMKVLKTMLSFTNLNLNYDAILSFVSISKDVALDIQLCLYLVTIFFSIYFLSVMAIVHNQKKCSWAFSDKTMYFLKFSVKYCYIISELFFIPIIIAMFRIFSCTLETDEEPVFLDYFCKFNCWTTSHIIFVIFSSFLLVFYSYFVLISIPELEELKRASRKFHFPQNTHFKRSFILLKIMIASISVLLSFQTILMIFFILALEVMILILSFFIKPYGRIKRLNIMVTGEFFILTITSIGSIIGILASYVNLNYVIFPILILGSLTILILLLTAPELLKSFENLPKITAVSNISERRSMNILKQEPVLIKKFNNKKISFR